MDNKEQVFTQMVREHKSTIYSVCYMFSKDTDEIDDLFQEVLIRLWKGTIHSAQNQVSGPGFTGSRSTAASMPTRNGGGAESGSP